MSITYNPVGLTHIVLGFIWGVSLIAINAIEFVFLTLNAHTIAPSTVFFIVIQNVGVALANSYYLSKIQVLPSGLRETTTKP